MKLCSLVQFLLNSLKVFFVTCYFTQSANIYKMIGKMAAAAFCVTAWLDCAVSTLLHTWHVMSRECVPCPMNKQALLTHNSPTAMHRDEKMLAHFLTLTRIFCTRQAKRMVHTSLFTIRCHKIHTEYYPLYPVISVYDTVY